VRCRDCGQRFVVPAQADRSKLAIGALLAVGVVLAVGGMVFASYWRGPDLPEPSAEALSPAITPMAMKAAEAGDADAQYAVANALLADQELNLAYSSKALGFLQQAAEKGHVRAMLRLGLIYRQGVDAPQNYALAAKWIERSARLGEPQGMLELGRLYREGVGVSRDPIKAYIWFNRAAAARDTDAPRERAEVARHLGPAELQQAQDESTASHVDSTAAGSAPTIPAEPASTNR
jgi:hypothetical protein